MDGLVSFQAGVNKIMSSRRSIGIEVRFRVVVGFVDSRVMGALRKRRIHLGQSTP